MSKPLSLPEIQQKLEQMFRYTSDFALGKDSEHSEYAPEVKIAAAQAAAQLAGMLMGINELMLMFGIPPDLDDPDDDPDPDEDRIDLDEGFESEPE